MPRWAVPEGSFLEARVLRDEAMASEFLVALALRPSRLQTQAGPE